MSMLKSLTRNAQFFRCTGCGNGSMIVLTPDGRGKIISDKRCIELVQQIMEKTTGFDVVYDRGASVLDVDFNGGGRVNDGSRKFESGSGITFPFCTPRALGTSLE